MSVLIFLVVLVVLILVHEWGHFIVAKLTGMRVDEFGVGFPPKVASFKKGETEYSLNWLPIGGFVRIWGENYEENEETQEKLSDKERARAFNARPKWAQAAVLVAGVTMNILFAWLLFIIILMSGTWSAVSEADATEDAKLMVADILPDSPAKDNLPAGVIITEIATENDTITSPTASEFTGFVSAAGENQITIQYQKRTGENTEALVIEPKQGIFADDPERFGLGVSVMMIELQKYSLLEAVGKGFMTTVYGLRDITLGLYGLIRDAVVGEADFSNVAGPVGIVGMVDEAASYGMVALLTFSAIISLNLAIINLLPFPALDGGRLVFVAIEAITRKPIPPLWAGRVNLIGFAILMLLMVAVTYSDIMKIISN
jgi:regulator of sigma E protease